MKWVDITFLMSFPDEFYGLRSGEYGGRNTRLMSSISAYSKGVVGVV